MTFYPRSSKLIVMKNQLNHSNYDVMIVGARAAGVSTAIDRQARGIRGYYGDLRSDESAIHPLYRAGIAAGVIPTSGGATHVFTGLPPERLARAAAAPQYQRAMSTATTANRERRVASHGDLAILSG